MPPRIYQDKWRNGRLVEPGRRPCEFRYKHIHEALKTRLGPGFTVADVGGADAYFLRRLEEDLGAKGTLVEHHDANLSGYQIQHKRMLVTDENADEIGYHDVILALSVMHHIPNWRSVYRRLKNQCRILIVEAAHPKELQVPKMSRTISKAKDMIGPQYDLFKAEAYAELCVESPIDKPEAKRPTLLIQCASQGKIEDGKGNASTRMPQDPAYWEKLEFLPYPGTLNINVGTEDRNWFRNMDGIEVDGLKYVPARVNKMGGYIRFSRAKGVVEFLSPYRLRDALSLKNGDVVEVRPR